jgi:hypothetical protein
MANLCDSHDIYSGPGGSLYAGQTFTGNGEYLSYATFRLRQGTVGGGATGMVYARLYATTGTFGTDMVPTGSPIAESGPIDFTSIPTTGDTGNLIQFDFSGTALLTNATKYAIVTYFARTSGTSNLSNWYGTLDNASHAGNRVSSSNGSSWSANSDIDNCFYVYTEASPPSNTTNFFAAMV